MAGLLCLVMEFWEHVPAAVAAVAASVAAFASVATWLRGRPAVDWQPQRVDKHRCRIVNVGGRAAYDVQVRVGSASDPSHSVRDMGSESEIVRRGEYVSCSSGGINGADDFAFNLSWRAKPGRGRWQRRTFPVA